MPRNQGRNHQADGYQPLENIRLNGFTAPATSVKHSLRYNFAPNVAGRRADLASFQKLVLHGRALNNKPCPVQLALITRSGSIYGGTVMLEPKSGTYSLPLNQLKPVNFVSLPRPYPSFLPYFIHTNTAADRLDLSSIETLQLSIGPGIPPPS